MNKRLLYLMFIIFIAAISGALYGYDIGIIAGALLVLPKDIPMTPAMIGFAGGAVLAGGAITILLAGPAAELIGRKKMILISAVIFLIGVLLLGRASTYLEIIVGRLVQGIGVGIVTIVIPMYLAEILPGNVRGRGMSSFQWFLKLGVFSATLVGLALTSSGNWRMMFISSGVPGIILLATCFFLPESPRWLIKRGRNEEAYKILLKICHHEEADAIIKNFSLDLNSTGQKGFARLIKSIKNLFKKEYSKPIFIVFTVAILNQLLGNNSLVPYSGILLKNAGLGSNHIAMIGSSTMTGIGILGTLVCMVLIDKVGRRKVLCTGLSLVLTALVVSGFAFLCLPVGIVRGFVILLGLLTFAAGYSVGPGVIIWLIISELLPNEIRSTGMSIALFLNSLASALLASVFFSLSTYINIYGVYWLCGIFTLCYLLIAIFMLPETKNKTLEEIEKDFITKKA
ncbi:MAG: sugar porter family MFS transporter [Lentisphaerota bacterium]